MLSKDLNQQQFAARDGHFGGLTWEHFIADTVLVVTVDRGILQRIFGVGDRHALCLSAEIEQRKISTGIVAPDKVPGYKLHLGIIVQDPALLACFVQ